MPFKKRNTSLFFSLPRAERKSRRVQARRLSSCIRVSWRWLEKCVKDVSNRQSFFFFLLSLAKKKKRNNESTFKLTNKSLLVESILEIFHVFVTKFFIAFYNEPIVSIRMWYCLNSIEFSFNGKNDVRYSIFLKKNARGCMHSETNVSLGESIESYLRKWRNYRSGSYQRQANKK